MGLNWDGLTGNFAISFFFCDDEDRSVRSVVDGFVIMYSLKMFMFL